MVDAIVVGTRNKGKLVEIQAILRPFVSRILSLDDIGAPPEVEPPETAATFADIAIAKPKAYAELAQLPTLADDSGLMIDALDGQPGVHSKRFFTGSEAARNAHVLSLLKDTPDPAQRTAHFICVICLYDPKTKTQQCFEGRVDGQIALSSRGSEGFGYDPIFIPNGYNQTFAELGKTVKNSLSHRARALQKLQLLFQSEM